MPSSKLPPAEWRKSIPEALKRDPHWVGHRKKVPFHPVTRRLAKVNDPTTWGTFEEAAAYYAETWADPDCGAGRVFTEDDGCVLIDLDHMVETERNVFRWLPGSEPVQALLKQAPLGRCGYAEVSPSGTGVHIIFKGRLPLGTSHLRKLDGEMKLEVWDQARYVTITGQRTPLAGDVVENPALLAAVVDFVGTHEVPAVAGRAEPERAREVAAALSWLDPDMEYPAWVKVGMALKAGLGDAGRDLWVAWSREGQKYTPGSPDSPEAKWSSFGGTGVGLGSLLWMAEQAGWSGPARPSAQDVFKEFLVAPPEGVIPDPKQPRVIVASELRPENIDWLWNGRIAIGMLWLVVGEPGKGKSLMVIDGGARITRGLPFPGDRKTRRPGRIIVLNAEDHASAVVRPRLDAAGCDLERAVMLNLGGQQCRLPSEIGWLRELIRRYADADYLVLDPLATVLDPGLDSNSMSDVRKALDPLSTLGALTKVSPGVVHHFNKGADKHGIYRIAGSVGITAASRYVMAVGPDPDDEDSPVRHVGVLKSNGALVPTLQFIIREKAVAGVIEPVPYIEWRGVSALSPRDITRTAGPERRTRGNEAAEWLELRLASGEEVPARLIFEEGQAQGFGEQMLRRAGKRLGVSVKILGPAGALWQKPLYKDGGPGVS